MKTMRDARNGDTPGIAHRGRNFHSILKFRPSFTWNPETHLAAEIISLEFLVGLAPGRRSRWAHIRESDGKCFGTTIDHAASRKPTILSVEVVDGDAGAGPDPVAGLLAEQAHNAGANVIHKISAHPVILVSHPFWKPTRLGIQKQSWSLRR